MLELGVSMDYHRLASDKDVLVAGLFSGWVWSRIGVVGNEIGVGVGV